MPNNRVLIAGRLLELKSLRYTPAGVPVTEIRIEHSSRQTEANVEREVNCELAAVALGDTAKMIQGAKLGDAIRAEGFLANRGKSTKNIVLHITNIEFFEGN